MFDFIDKLLFKNSDIPTPSEEHPDPYDIGYAAARAGKEHWENPYSEPASTPGDFKRWYAGWCLAMQHRNEKGLA